MNKRQIQGLKKFFGLYKLGGWTEFFKKELEGHDLPELLLDLAAEYKLYKERLLPCEPNKIFNQFRLSDPKTVKAILLEDNDLTISDYYQSALFFTSYDSTKMCNRRFAKQGILRLGRFSRFLDKELNDLDELVWKPFTRRVIQEVVKYNKDCIVVTSNKSRSLIEHTGIDNVICISSQNNVSEIFVKLSERLKAQGHSNILKSCFYHSA